MEQQVKSENYNIEITNGILYVDALTENLTFDIVDEMIKLRHKITNGKTLPILGDFKNVKYFPRDARERMADKDAGAGTYCAALVIRSPTQAVLFNFFNRIYKAPSPTKLFSDRSKAEDWIKIQRLKLDKELAAEGDDNSTVEWREYGDNKK